NIMKKTTHLRKVVDLMLKNMALLISLYFLGTGAASAQNVACPPNIDFEQGNYGNWKYEVGSAVEAPTTDTNGAIWSRPQQVLTIPITNPNPPPWSAGNTLQPGPTSLVTNHAWARFDTTSSS